MLIQSARRDTEDERRIAGAFVERKTENKEGIKVSPNDESEIRSENEDIEAYRISPGSYHSAG